METLPKEKFYFVGAFQFPNPHEVVLRVVGIIDNVKTRFAGEATIGVEAPNWCIIVPRF